MRALFGILIIILIALGGYWLLDSQAPMPSPTPNATSTATTTSVQTYNSAEYGIEFRYPAAYQLEERNAPGSAMRTHHTITLMRKTDLPPRRISPHGMIERYTFEHERTVRYPKPAEIISF